MADNRSIFLPVDIDSGAGSELAQGVNLRISASGGSIEAKGQQLAADSIPVVLASDDTPSVDTELPAAAALADNASNPTAPAVGAFAMVWDGATWDRAPGDSADGLLVNLGTNNDVTITGSVDTELPAAAALADDTANPSVPGVGAFLMGWDATNTNWNRVEVDVAGHLQVDILSGGGSDTPTNPVIDTQTSAAVAVNTPTDIDSSEAASKKLAWIDIFTTVPFKAEIFTVDDGVESTRKGVIGGKAFDSVKYEPTHRDYITLGTNAGADTFRVKVTNLDDNLAADFHVVFHYED